jgi:hypothetical protein
LNKNLSHENDFLSPLNKKLSCETDFPSCENYKQSLVTEYLSPFIFAQGQENGIKDLLC